MSPDGSMRGASLALGPVRLVERPAVSLVVGLAFAFAGASILAWALDARTAFAAGLFYANVGLVVALTGAYLCGVRVR